MIRIWCKEFIWKFSLICNILFLMLQHCKRQKSCKFVVHFHSVNVKISKQISLKNSAIYFCQVHTYYLEYIIIFIDLQLLIPTYLLCTSWILDSLIVLNWLKLCQKLPTHEKYMSNFKAIIPTVVSMYLRKIVGAVVQGISSSLFFWSFLLLVTKWIFIRIQ